MSKESTEIERNLIVEWFKTMGKVSDPYREPILSLKEVARYKEVCDSFQADSQVFIMSVEIAEDYIRIKRERHEQIPDSTFLAVVAVFISYKNDGAPDTLKLNQAADILLDLTKKFYHCDQIQEMEVDIIMSLGGKLPVTTKLDDLNLIIEKFINQYALKVNLRPLCVKLLECVYIERKKWFRDLKKFYSQDQVFRLVFEKLIMSKFYLPMGVLLAALFITNYKYVLDMNVILNDITKQSDIHQDHLCVIALRFIDIFYD